MPDVEAPEIELDEDAPQFRRRLALVVVLITLFGAVVAYLHEQNSNLEDNAAREAQIQAIKGFGKQVDSSTEFQFDYRLFVQQQLLQRRQLVAQSRQRSTDSSLATVYGSDATRWGDLSTALSNGAAIQKDADVNTKDAELQVEPDRARLTQLVFADKANDYGNKADAYVALLTVLAVGLFLIGLSLTVSGRGRYLLAIPGVAIAVVCVVWAVFITTGSVTKVSPKAVDLTAEGQQKQIANDVQGAIDNYKAAIADSPSFGPAFARLADAEFDNGVNNSAGNEFESIADRDATKRAVAAGEKAISLGENNPSLLSSIGFFHFTLGEYDRAEQLSQQAVDANDQIAPLIFNLAVTEAAKNEKSAARKTYDRGIAVLNKEQDTFLRQEVASAALTDLEIANATATSAKDLIQEMKGKLVDAEFATGTDAAGGKAQDVEVSVDAFHRLQAQYTTSDVDDGTDLTNIWYFRPLDSDGKGPYVQTFSLDSVSKVADDGSNTGTHENGDCLPGGDYRVEIYAGSKLIGSNNDKPFHVPDSPIGKLVVQGGEDVGMTLCRPEGWSDTSSSENGTLSAQNPDDQSQTILAFSFPFGTSEAPSSDLLDAAISGVAETDQLTGLSAPSDGTEFLGRTADGTEVELTTRTVVGRTPQGRSERVSVSFSNDGIVRIAVITASNDDDATLLATELIDSLRFLDVPEPTP